MMPGKKAHVKKNIENAGMHGLTHPPAGAARKSTGEIEGQYTRDIKRRKGQFTAEGDAPLTKK